MKHWARLKLWYRGCSQIRVSIPFLKGTKENDQKWAESTQVLKCYVDKLQVQANLGWPKEKLPGRKHLPGNIISLVPTRLRPQKGSRNPGLWLTASLELDGQARILIGRWRGHLDHSSWQEFCHSSRTESNPSMAIFPVLHPIYQLSCFSSNVLQLTAIQALGFPGELHKWNQFVKKAPTFTSLPSLYLLVQQERERLSVKSTWKQWRVWQNRIV